MKRFIFSTVIFFLITGFIAAGGEKEKVEDFFVPEREFKYTVIPENPRPGEPVTIAATRDAVKAVLLADGKQRGSALFFTVPAEDDKPDFLAAILTIPSTVEPGIAVIRLEGEDGAICDKLITVEDREFPSETLRLNPSLTNLLTQPDPKKAEESRKLWEVLSTFGSDVYAGGTFLLPIETTRRTSRYGGRRIQEYSNGRKDTSIHAGVDFGAPTGTPVTACASGKVVLAVMRIISGNSVIIEHVPGVFSIYYHLSKIEVTEGDIVTAGTLIGEVGATGFATGPHLHWEVRVNGENTDPDVFVSRPLIDKDLIISKIFN